MSLHQLQDFARLYWAALDTPLSNFLANLADKGEWGDIIRRKPMYVSMYENASAYHKDVLATTLLKKCDGLAIPGEDPELQAKETWLSCEEQCFRTNRRLRDEHLSDEAMHKKHEFFRAVTRNFYKLVGKPPTLGDFESPIRFGPGSVIETIEGRTTALDKIASDPMLTKNSLCLARLINQSAWGRRETLFPVENCSEFRPIHFLADEQQEGPLNLVTKGNKWASVAKTAITDRNIGIEPGGNLSIQMAIGTALRRGLNRYGLLLKPRYKKWWGGLWETQVSGDSQATHKRLAREASINGRLATLDARNASDTICTELVKLSTGEWWPLFKAARSPFTIFPFVDRSCGPAKARKVAIYLEKISSMGNGFTFELETALFAAIAMTIADSRGVQLTPNVNFGVYGDDIIVPVELAEEIAQALEYCGISINEDKSFSSGPFRESCGGDYFDGTPVRGLYAKKVPETPGDWIVLHNMFARAPEDVKVGHILRKIIDLIPENLRNYGPPELGDIVLHHRNWERKAKWRYTREGWRQLRVTVPGPQSYTLNRWDTISVLVAKLYGMEGDEITPRPKDDDYIPFYAKWVEFG